VNTILEAALEYASKGWRVFPLHSAPNGICTCGDSECRVGGKRQKNAGKHPRTHRGVKDASTDPNLIHSWFDAPGANLGLATGIDNGLVVLDVDDTDSFGQLLAEHGELPDDCPMFKTGRGFQVVFSHPPGKRVANSAGKIAKGIDVRGAGGYVVAPPSVHYTGNQYTWLQYPGVLHEPPEWMISRKADAEPIPVEIDSEAAHRELLEEAWEHLEAQGPAIEGQAGDEHTLNACRLLANGYRLTEGECWALLSDWNVKCVPPWDEAGLRTKLRNAVAYPGDGPHGAQRFVHMLGFSKWGRKYREERAGAVTATDSTFESAISAARLDLEKYGWGTAQQRIRGRLEPVSKTFEEAFPTVPWLVRGILREKAVVAIAAEPKSTKTWNAAEIALSVATGTKAFGEFPVIKSGPVVYFFAEDERRSVRNRFRALAKGKELDPILATDRVYARYREAMKLESIEDLAWLVADCRALPEPPALIVLDPMRDIHDSEENDSTAMAGVMGRLRALRDVLGCTVLFVHHSAKGSLDTAGRRAGQRMRGSSVIHGAVDGGFYLYDLKTDNEKTWDTNVEVEVKGARSAGQFALKLEVEDNLDGEAVLAKWTFQREQASKDAESAKKTENLVGVIRDKLRMRWIDSRGNPTALSEKEIREFSGAGTKKVHEAIEHLNSFGRVRHTANGMPRKGAGWVYVPEIGDLRLVEGTPPPEGVAENFAGEK
jgi:RecA-family ATPase